MKKRACFFLLLLSCMVFPINMIFGQNIEWAQKIAPRNGYISRIASDGQGNSFLCGAFIDTCVFGTTSIVSSGYGDGFLAKYNPTGAIQWVNKIEGSMSESVENVCTDRFGNIYIIGAYESTTNFNGTNIHGNGSYLAKYTTSGSLMWVHALDTLHGAHASEITVSDSGSVFIAGNIYSQANFDCATLNKGTSETQFIARYDSNGVCQWAKTFITTYLMDIAVDKKTVFI